MITQILFSIIAAIYFLCLLISLVRGEIIFSQGKGVKSELEKKKFLRWFLYHLVLCFVLISISIYSWIMLDKL